MENKEGEPTAMTRMTAMRQHRPKKVTDGNKDPQRRDARPKFQRPLDKIDNGNGATGGEFTCQNLDAADVERPRCQTQQQHGKIKQRGQKRS